MEMLYVLIPIALILVAIAFATFMWAVKNDQYEDLETPAHRILFDDDEDMIPEDCRPAKPESSEKPPGA